MIFFIHIPKTAGTSLRSCLTAALGDRLVPAYDENRRRDWRFDAVVGRRLPDNAVLFGHFMWGFHERFNRPERYAAVLRHPVDRIVSWYSSAASNSRRRLHAEIRAGVPLAALVTSRLLPALSNQMVTLIAGRTPEYLDDFETLRLAKRNLRRLEYVSVTELLQTDMHRMSELVGAVCQPLVHQNQSRAKAVDDATRRVILRHNALDLQLYTLAKRLAMRARGAEGPPRGSVASGSLLDRASGGTGSRWAD